MDWPSGVWVAKWGEFAFPGTRNQSKRHWPWKMLGGCLGIVLLALELRTSQVQSRVLAATSRRAAYMLGPGAGPAIRYPKAAPYDSRLGYAHLSSFLERLQAAGFRPEAQARLSKMAARLIALGLSPPYREKSQTGLAVLDRAEEPLFVARYPGRTYPDLQSIPPLVVASLLFIENREVLDSSHDYRNPAVEWDRLAKAILDVSVHQVYRGHPISGGSTLATQLEKLRHSPGGRTASAGEKFRQMATASLRAYQDGPRTLEARRRIVCDYLNSLPLASLPGYGEVSGLGDGLWAWYGADFDRVNHLLRSPEAGQEQALAYRQVLSLLLALTKPTVFLLHDRAALDARIDGYLRLLAESRIITAEFRDLVLESRVQPRDRAPDRETVSFAERKGADSIRAALLPLLGIDSTYDLDRLDLTVRTTLDAETQKRVTEALRNLSDPEYSQAAGITGYRLLGGRDPQPVIYSFTLYERGPGVNWLRVEADTYDQPLNINAGTKLELGSTAKLRTLISYLELVAELHQRYSKEPPDRLRALLGSRLDRLTSWALGYLLQAPDRALAGMLEAAMNRSYSADPGEFFFTGGGLHEFANFDRKDNGAVLTVREAFQRSVNLVFIRLMRDIAQYHTHQLPGFTPVILTDPNHPARKQYLSRFADREGREFLAGFYKKYQGQTPEQIRETLLAGRKLTPRRVAALSEPERWSLNDRGYLARVHPLELWLVEYLGRHPEATLEEVYRASAAERQEVYQWLFRNRNKHGQDVRIQTMLEVDAFERIHRSWKRAGFPFPSLVPSYATAIGSSGDKPAALAELMGILLNDGVRNPSQRIRQIHFAEGTPFETILSRQPGAGERVMDPAIARKVRQELIGVVDKGTARRASGTIRLGDGRTVAIGGKTGTGDNRVESSVQSRVINRTATFVFFIGDRFFGTVTAYVPGQQAEDYKFTSALAVQVFRHLLPSLLPLVG
ncbi:MAG: transglycosylase domain-containing protein [Acidobacteria bacterium]|nr:transglycosylase domain-containing protein [Acidobacteriota bacterium]